MDTNTPAASWLDKILNSGTTLFGSYLSGKKPVTPATTTTTTTSYLPWIIGASVLLLVVILLVRK